MHFYSTLKTTSVDQRAVHAIQNTQNRYKHYKYKIRIQYIKTSNKKMMKPVKIVYIKTVVSSNHHLTKLNAVD